MSEEKMIDINEEVFASRIEIIKQQLVSIVNELRKEIDETKNTQDLIKDEKFKTWLISNEVLKMIESNENFARLVYFMHGECDSNIYKVLAYYDIDFEFDDNNNLTKLTLITLEEQDE